MAISKQQDQEIRRISQKFKTSPTFIKALFGLSKPALTAALVWLTKTRNELNQKANSLDITSKWVSKRQQEAQQQFNTINDSFGSVKNILNTLNLGEEFSSTPEAQDLLNLILKGVKLKEGSITGYRDVENILTVSRARVQQLINFAAVGEASANAAKAQIKRLDTFISIIREVTGAKS